MNPHEPISDPGKPRYPRALAIEVAKELVRALAPACESERLIVGGSLRRRKEHVGDVEIVYVPVIEQRKGPTGDWFAPEAYRPHNQADEAIALLIEGGVIAPRTNSLGHAMLGESNKLLRHVRTGIPVDLFSIRAESWWNYVVCRTGGAATNVAIATAAKRLGWHWSPYSPGFKRRGAVHAVRSEREVFDFVGLEYREPWERD